MTLQSSPQARRDAEVIYERAYEFHGVIGIADAHELGSDWQPPTRVALAIQTLLQDGLMRLETFRGRRMLRTQDAVDAVQRHDPPA